MQYPTLGDSTLPLAMMFRAIVLGATVLLLTGLYSILQTLIRPMFSPLRLLKGPGGASLLFGHVKQIIDSPSPSSWEAEQLDTYGHVLVYKFAFNQDRLLTTDRKALHHILTNSNIYIKGLEFRRAIVQIAGKGILYQEGNGHKRHRRILNPAFGTAPLREMTGIFVNKANEMRDALDIAYRKESTTEWTEVDMVQYLIGATLDIIGLAGFNHQFDSIHHLVEGTRAKDEFSVALRKTFKHLDSFSLLDLLKSYIPVLRLINFDPRSLAIKKEREIVKAISGPMIREKKIALQIPSEKNNAKDLLALLIQANTREGGENAARSLTEEEVMDQIPTFLIAGHETTSTAMSWTLITLATHPDVQSRLRQELLEVSTENPTMEELNALPYLERVIRESLRYNSIVPGTWRVAAQDDVIPLERPYIDKNGNIRHEIRVAKGDGVIIPIKIINQLEEIWGPDAKQFNPDRWLDVPEASGDIPGVWGNQLTFIGGPRACIGFRFSLVEMKALLFAIVRSFELKLPVPPEEIIGSKMGPTTSPSIRSRPERGVHLPILIKPIKQD